MSTDPLLILALIVGGTLSALIGVAIGKPRGAAGVGAVAGLLMGPIGWLAVWLCYPVCDAQPTAAGARSTFRKPDQATATARTTFRTPDQAEKERAWRRAVEGQE